MSGQTTDSDTAPDLTGTPTSVPSIPSGSSSPPSVDWYNDDVSPPQFFSITAASSSIRVPLVITRPNRNNNDNDDGNINNNRNNTSSPSDTIPSIQSISTRSSSTSSSHSGAGAMRTLSFSASTTTSSTSVTSTSERERDTTPRNRNPTEHNMSHHNNNNNFQNNDDGSQYQSLLSARSRSRSRDDESSLAWSPPVSPVMNRRGKSASMSSSVSALSTQSKSSKSLSTSKSKSSSIQQSPKSPKSPKKKKSKSEEAEEDVQNAICLNLAKDALKVNDAMVYLEGPAIYTCSECRTHLTSHDEIISKSFHGRHGRAYLFDACVNITTGPAEDRRLITGLHSVCDIFCKRCRTLIGWTYARAYEPSQRYKEGKFIIEKINLHMEESDYYQVTQPAGERRDKWKIRSMSWGDESYSHCPRHRHDRHDDETSMTSSTVYEYRSRARSSSTISWASTREIPATPP